ncbi:MAG TPA: PAS domain-containing protein [Nannocystis sp.]
MTQPESSTPADPSSEVQALRAEIAALRARVNLMDAVIAASPAVMFAKDIEGRLTLGNRKYEQIFPHVEGGLLGKTDLEIMGGEAAEVVRANDRRVREGGVPIEFEELVPQVDGLRTYITIKFPLYDDQGACIGVAGVATDITERKRAEDDRAALQQQIIEIQRATLSELSTPVIPLAEGVIAMPLVGAIDSERARQITEALLDGLASSRAHTAILDITGVRAVDSHVAGALLQSARAARLLGARVIITGIRAEVAQALVQIGTDWTGIETLSTLQSGVALALSRSTR